MQLNILKKLRKDWLVQEFAINLIPVPALAYFVWTCFPFAKENAVHFFGFITFALGGCFGAGFAGRKIAARKMVRIFTQKRPSDPEELSVAKVQAFNFPFASGMIIFVRWTLLAIVFGFFPLYLQGTGKTNV